MNIHLAFLIALILMNSAKGSLLIGNAVEEFIPGDDKPRNSGSFSFDTEGCGVSKGCYMSPHDCHNEDCDIFLSWKEENDKVHFEFSYALDTEIGEDQWIAIALSTKDQMSDGSVIACRHYNNTEDIVSAYNPGYRTNLLEDVELGLDPSSLSMTFQGSRIDCEFSRYIQVDPTLPDADKVFNLNQPYFYQIGAGPMEEDGRMRKHRTVPIVTSQIDTSKNEVIGGTFSPLLKAHACLMIAAWVLLAGIGMIIPRYYKAAWELEIQKIKMWFWIHRTIMLFVVALTVCGFIIIFYQVNGLTRIGSGESAVESSHAIIGIIVMALTLINPAMAFFRPGPGTKKRLAFTWAHRILGESGRILAVANIMTGFWIPRSELFTERWMFWTMVGLVAFHCLIEAILYFLTSMGKNKASAFEDETDDRLELVGIVKKTDNRLQTTMLFSYGIVMFAFSICMFVGIGIK